MLRSIAVICVVIFMSTVCLADEQTREKLRQARAQAERLVKASGPVRLEAATPPIPREWQPQSRIVGTYSNYANRNTFITPWLGYCGPYASGYGNCFWGWWGFGFGRGWYPLGGYSCGYSGW